MHIPENYLSPATCAVMAAAMVPVWAHAVRKVNTEMPREKLPMLGMGAAFSFLVMMFNVPLPGGTTGHAVGGTLIALLFGPDAACIAMSVALLLQAVIFGDGGILSFGANCFNMAFVLPYVGYGIYRLILRIGKEQKHPRLAVPAGAVGAYVGINAAALCAAVEFGLQPMLFRDALGNALYCPYDLSVSIPAMMLSHLTVAGLLEAGITAAVFAFVRKADPVLSENLSDSTNQKRRFPVFALLAALIVLTPLGLLAQGTAWGEWDAAELAEIVTDGSPLGYTPAGMQNGWSLTALLPDYSLSGVNEVLGYVLSAVIGAALLIILFKLLSLLRGRRHPHAS